MKSRNTKKYLKWQKEVFERDNYECQKCKSKKGIVAHHIIPWNEAPLLRVDLNNGQTLCRKCHMSHHKNKKGAKVGTTWNKGLKGISSGMPKGSKFTPEHKAKLSAKKKGKPSHNKGIPMKETTKEIFRKMFKGKKWTINPETHKRQWID